jgi:hypothetical protein
VAVALFAAIFLVTGIGGLSGWPALARLSARYGIVPWTWWLWIGVIAAGLLAWLGLRRGMLALVLTLVAFWISWSTWGYRLLDGVRSPRDLMQEVVRITGPGDSIAMPDFDEEFFLQARQPMVHFGRRTPYEAQLRRAFAWFAEAPDRRWMLIEQNWAPVLQCTDLRQAKDLGFQNGDTWWLIPGAAFSGCAGDAGAAPLYLAPTTAAITP